MKFTLIAQVVSNKTGLDLDDEYDRLGFEKRPSLFPLKQVTVEVDKDFVKSNRDLFGNDTCARVTIDSEKTIASDWENWGSCGHMLSTDVFTAEKIMSLA